MDEISKISALENSLSNKIKALEKQHQSLNIDVGNEFYNGIQIAINNLTVARENFAAAESRIRDVDVASEAAELTRLSILQQAGASVLAQANQQPQLALSLLR